MADPTASTAPAAPPEGEPARIVDVYADVSCPFAHFSLRRFSERRRQAGADHVRLRVYAWPLELVNGEPLGVGKVVDEIADLRAQVQPRRRTPCSRPVRRRLPHRRYRPGTTLPTSMTGQAPAIAHEAPVEELVTDTDTP